MSNVKTYARKAISIAATTTTIAWSMGLASLVPVAHAQATVALNPGDLIKAPEIGAAVYYYGADNKRYVFPTLATYQTWYSDFSAVKNISRAAMEAIPLAGSNVTYRPGVRMIKVTSVPTVYAIEKGGVLRAIASEAVAAALYGADWNRKIDDLPDSFFSNYTAGATVNAAADYNVSTATAASATIAVDRNIAGGVVVTGALSVALASDSPASASVANNASDVVFTRLTFTGSGTITGMKVLRSGLSADSRLTAIKLFDGTTQVGTSQTLNAQHKAVFSGLHVALSGSKTLTIAGNIVSTGGSGEVVRLGLEQAADVTLSGGTIPSGTFPIAGNGMTITAVTIGTVRLDNGPSHPSSNQQPAADAVDFRFTQVRITAGSTEDIQVKQLVAIRSGTAADSDVKDVKLVNDTSGAVLVTVPTLTNGRATFDNLSVTVKKGEYVDLSVKATLTGSGSNRTLGFELHDGVDYLVRVVGALYGFGINVPATGTGSGNFCATTGIGANGPLADGSCQLQTIALGTLQVNKSPSSPATGNVAVGGTLVPMAAYDFVVTGEPVTISSMKLTVLPASGSSAADLTNIGFYNSSGVLVAGPKDGSTTTANTNEQLTYSDSFTLPVGTNVLTVKATISNSALATETYQLRVDAPNSNVTVKGQQSGKSVTATPATNIAGNVMTVQGPSLVVTTLGTPVAGSATNPNTVIGMTKYTFATLSLDASRGGEDVKVTQVVVTDTLGTGTDYSGVANLELWGDPDTSDTTAVVQKLETTQTTNTNAATVTFTFKSPLKVARSSGVSTLYLRGDPQSTTGTSHRYNVAAAANVTASGWTTGSSVTTPLVSGSGQAQFIASSGVLTVEAGGNRQTSAQFASGQSGVEWMRYKFSATGESVDVKTIPMKISVNGSAITSATSDIAGVKFYTANSLSATPTQLGGALTFNANGALELTGATAAGGAQSPIFTVPKDGSQYLFIKVDLSPDNQIASGRRIQIGIPNATYVSSDGTLGVAAWGANGANSATGQSYKVTATGHDSGQTVTATTINSNGNATTGTIVASYDMYVFDTVLSVARDPSEKTTPSGSNTEVLRLRLTASGTAGSSDILGLRDLEFVKSGSCSTAGTVGAGLYLDATDGRDTNKVVALWSSANSDVSVANFHVNSANTGNTRVAGAISATANSSVVAGTAVYDDGASTAFGAAKALLVVPAGASKVLRLIVDASGCANASSLTYTLGAPSASAGTTSGIQWFDRDINASGASGISGTPSYVDQTITVGSGLSGRNYTAF